MTRLIRPLFIRCLLVAFGVFISLILGELTVRLATSPYAVTRTPVEFVTPNKVGFIPLSRWQLTEPEFQTTVEINSLGYRDLEIDPEKATIVVLGDSQTFGTGVNAGERMSDHVRAYVEQNCPNYNVLNVSMPGASTYDERRFLADVQRKGVSVRYVLLNIVTNDHVGNENDENDPPEFDTEDNKASATKSRFSIFVQKHRYDSRLVMLLVRTLSAQEWFASWYTNMKFDLGIGEFRALHKIYLDEAASAAQFQFTKRAITKIRALAPVTAVLIPDRYRVDPLLHDTAATELRSHVKPGQILDFDRESRLIKSITEELEVELIDPIENFRRAPDPSALSFPINGHLTRAGQALLGHEVLKSSKGFATVCPASKTISNENR